MSFVCLSTKKKLFSSTQDSNDAKQQIYILQRDKLTLINNLTTLQQTKTFSGGGGGVRGEGDLSMSSKWAGFIRRN